MDRIIHFVKTHKSITIFSILTLLVFLSHGKTWQMYFWVDDWAMTYKVLWPEESLTNMARGIYGTGPYRYLITPFAFLYPFFKFNAFPYFFVGWIIYLLAAFAVYLLTFELTKKQHVAFSASAIFASGYIGAHALYRLTNSYQTAGGALFIILSVWLFLKYLKDGKTKLYWAALILYTLSIELFFIRTHGLFLSILGVSLLYKLTERTKLAYKSLLLKQLPFLGIFYFMYFLDPRIKIYSNLVLRGMNAILKKGEVWLFNNFNINFANALIPDGITAGVYTKLLALPGNTSPNIILVGVFISGVLLYRKSTRIYKALACLLLAALYFFSVWSSSQQSSFWNPRDVEIFTSILGGGLIVFFLYLGISLWQRKERMGLLILYLVSWIVVNTITLFIYSPETSLESTSRYFVPAFAGIGMLYGVTFWLTLKKPLAILSTVVVCSTLLYFSNKEANTLLNNVSIPDKQGYGLIQDEVKEVNKNTIFFIESEDDPRYKNNYLGRLPQLGISALYKYHGITKLANSYSDLFARLSSGEVQPENTYTYFFGPEGYRSTTNRFRELLLNGGIPKEMQEWSANTPFSRGTKTFTTQTLVSKNSERTVAINPILETTINYDSLTPSILELTMSLEAINSKDMKFPFYDLSQEFPLDTNKEMLDAAKPQPKERNSNDILASVEEEYEKQIFASSGIATATSSWLPGKPQDAIDNILDTNWSADNNKWNDGAKPQELYLDFGRTRNITRITWINHHYMSTPTNYSFYISQDGIEWQKLKEVAGGPRKDGGEEVVENLPRAATARYLKLSILETYGGKGYPPGVRELWISEQTLEVEKNRKERIVKCPFCYIPDSPTYEQTLAMVQKIAKARLWWKTDRNDAYRSAYSKDIQIFLGVLPYTYKIYLPPQGTKFTGFKIDGFQTPIRATIHKSTIRSLSLEETTKSGSGWDTGE